MRARPMMPTGPYLDASLGSSVDALVALGSSVGTFSSAFPVNPLRSRLRLLCKLPCTFSAWGWVVGGGWFGVVIVVRMCVPECEWARALSF